MNSVDIYGRKLLELMFATRLSERRRSGASRKEPFLIPSRARELHGAMHPLKQSGTKLFLLRLNI